MVGDDVRRSLAAVGDLRARVGDAAAPVPAMGADVGGVVVTHVVSCLAFYAHDLVASAPEVTAVDVVGRADADLAGKFPDVAPADDAWAALRWATGRGDLPGQPRPTSWRYAVAPRDGSPLRTRRGTTARPASGKPWTPR